jgi:hypothetical protein
MIAQTQSAMIELATGTGRYFLPLRLDLMAENWGSGLSPFGDHVAYLVRIFALELAQWQARSSQ